MWRGLTSLQDLLVAAMAVEMIATAAEMIATAVVMEIHGPCETQDNTLHCDRFVHMLGICLCTVDDSD
jgi:hypothetical protein